MFLFLLFSHLSYNFLLFIYFLFFHVFCFHLCLHTTTFANFEFEFLFSRLLSSFICLCSSSEPFHSFVIFQGSSHNLFFVCIFLFSHSLFFCFSSSFNSLFIVVLFIYFINEFLASFFQVDL